MHRADVAARIDHTLLTPEATAGDIDRLCAEAVELGVAAACVSPVWVARAVAAIGGAGPAVAAVIGFPSGAHHSETKGVEARMAVDDGATELDMVQPLGAALAGDWDRVRTDIAVVRAMAPPPVTLKVILETAVLSADQITAACRTAEEAGADYVKTSTGFHPAGGATIPAVELMASVVGGRLGVKASGGIRDAATALRFLEAGATRLGASASASILAGVD